MVNNIDIIIVGQQAWDIEIGSNCKNIALELSKYNRVMYVNPPLDRITKFKNSNDPKVKLRVAIIQGKVTNIYKIQDNLWVIYPNILIESINWIRSHKLFSYLNMINNKRFASSIQTAINYLGFKQYYLFNDSDIFRSFHLKELLKPILSIYYSRDNLIATDYWKRHGEVIEPLLIEKSDLCVSNSEYLKNYCKKYNHNSFYVGQGCDLDLFKESNLEIPFDLKSIVSPIIGYVGAITVSRLNINLISSIAKELPDCNIVLVGPQDDTFIKSELHKLKNVYFLGPKESKDLPCYINVFDVCINPQVLNDLTVGNYPRKIDEYLALGKPVVATKTDTMLFFKDYVSLASNADEFVRMIKDALNNDDQVLIEKRKEFAFSHSWENSVGKISFFIRNHLIEFQEKINL